jgi:hypothetical protein
MNELVEHIKGTYSGLIRRAGKFEPGTYCVGGAVCDYLASEEDWGGIEPSKRRYPYEDTLSAVFASVLGVDWEGYDYDEDYESYRGGTPPTDTVSNTLAYYSASILADNDNGDFDVAWGTASDMFNELGLRQCGECDRLYGNVGVLEDDARTSVGMKCGRCAYVGS